MIGMPKRDQRCLAQPRIGIHVADVTLDFGHDAEFFTLCVDDTFHSSSSVSVVIVN